MIMRFLFACSMVLFFAPPFVEVVPVFAQDQSTSDEHQPPNADDIIAKMQTKLNLTPDQANAITPIIEKYTSKREDLRQSMEDGTADRDNIRTQMKQLRVDEKQELSQVLSAEQLSQWSNMQHKHGSGGGSWGTGGGETSGDGSANRGGTSGSGGGE